VDCLSIYLSVRLYVCDLRSAVGLQVMLVGQDQKFLSAVMVLQPKELLARGLISRETAEAIEAARHTLASSNEKGTRTSRPLISTGVLLECGCTYYVCMYS
jgi:hypothetical protein